MTTKLHNCCKTQGGKGCAIYGNGIRRYNDAKTIEESSSNIPFISESEEYQFDDVWCDRKLSEEDREDE